MQQIVMPRLYREVSFNLRPLDGLPEMESLLVYTTGLQYTKKLAILSLPTHDICPSRMNTRDPTSLYSVHSSANKNFKGAAVAHMLNTLIRILISRIPSHQLESFRYATYITFLRAVFTALIPRSYPRLSSIG